MNFQFFIQEDDALHWNYIYILCKSRIQSGQNLSMEIRFLASEKGAMPIRRRVETIFSTLLVNV